MRAGLILLVTVTLLSAHQTSASEKESACVVLLHGLARTSHSMKPIEQRLGEAGFPVANIGYPSRHHPIEELADLVMQEVDKACRENQTIHFVTHSLGGILVRYYLSENELPNLGRVVMLAPPNQGSEIVDNLRNFPGFRLWNGPAGMQLGTTDEDLPRQLGPVEFELGIIAGDRSLNPLLSRYLPTPHDGKVSVASTKVEGMSDFLLVQENHTFIMRDSKVMDQVIEFLEEGRFDQRR